MTQSSGKVEAVAGGYVATRLSAGKRAVALLNAWRYASKDTDIEIRVGQSEQGEPAVFISIGDDMHAFLATEAEKLINVVAGTIDQFGQAAIDEGLDNLLMGLRQGVNAALEEGQ